MATARPTALKLAESVATSDAMDTHSDGDFTFGSGEGDIEIDIQHTEQHNDDLSIYDAASDMALEVQTVPADQDDFMADDEDILGEDAVINFEDNDVHVADAEQPANGAVETAENDDDLIDYSDDEEETMWTGHEAVAAAADVETDDVVKDDLNHDPQEQSAEAAEPNTQAHAYQDESNAVRAVAISDVSLPSSPEHGDDLEDYDDQLDQSLEAKEDPSTHDESTEEAKATLEDDSTYLAVDTSKVAEDDTALTEPNDKTKDKPQLSPVTVNYDGAELWLFKVHDYENSGDYLVEDEDLATKPLSNVLEACREPLGSDVSNDIELGFRLDNFHNIELFQEHTSCAFVTLESLLNLYHQLHIQDGVSNPESFYMTLLFRPRVSSLLNELQKAATEGIGHSGLERAIAAGLTAFTAQTSHNSTEHVPEDWVDGKEQQEQHITHVELEVQEDTGVDIAHDDRETSDVRGQERHDDDSVEQSVQSAGPAPATPAASAHNETPVAEDRSSAKNTVEGSQPLAGKSGNNSTHASPTSHNDDDDIIDYSDDEPEDEVAPTNAAQTTPPSSASSTVQGDMSNAPDNVDASADGTGDDVVDEASNGQAVDEEAAIAAYHAEQDALYEGFDESYAEEYGEENEHVVGVAGGVANEYPAEHPTYTGDKTTNQYDDVKHETGATRLGSSLDASDEHGNDAYPPSANPDNLVNDDSANLQAEDAFADFWAVENEDAYADADEIGFDDEDGAASQAPVAASVAAEPADTLSSELFELSPQGQKRTIDEVAIDADGATDASDAKRPRV